MDSAGLKELLNRIGQKIEHDQVKFPLPPDETLVVLVKELASFCVVVNNQEEADKTQELNNKKSSWRCSADLFLIHTDKLEEIPIGQIFATS